MSEATQYTEQEIEAMTIEAEEQQRRDVLHQLSPVFWDRADGGVYVIPMTRLKKQKDWVVTQYQKSTTEASKMYWKAYMQGIDIALAIATRVDS